MNKKIITTIAVALAIVSGVLAIYAKQREGTNNWASNKQILVNPKKCVIVIGEKPNERVSLAAQELTDHLKLITGETIEITSTPVEGHYTFYVGIAPDCDNEELKPEEARQDRGIKATYLYGDDSIGGKNPRYGSAFAVYMFLEDLGVRWVQPGKDGTLYPHSKNIVFNSGKYSWEQELVRRHIRMCFRNDQLGVENDFYTLEEFKKHNEEENDWRRRMRLGSNVEFGYGHAFTKWWDKYGKTNPEFFALSTRGTRAPVGGEKRADRIKMCVSSTGLVDKIIEEWQEKGMPQYLNVIENDSRDFCVCENCLALDVLLPGEEDLNINDRHMTDRYIYFTNAVQRKARELRPDVHSIFYAYSRYHIPPRREKLEDSIVVFFLPNLMVTHEESHDYYKKWKEANTQIAYLRPNDMNQDTGLPMGFEKFMFEKWEIANQYLTIRGTDYDTKYGFWQTSGITNYVMSKAFNDPNAKFSELEDEYCSAYGAAADDIKSYYAYWRENMWEGRAMQKKDLIQAITPGVKLFRTKQLMCVDLLYNDADFDKTDTILALAAAKALQGGRDYNKLNPKDREKYVTPEQLHLIKKLQLSNQHARLVFHTVNLNRLGSEAPLKERLEAAQRLADFRTTHKYDLDIAWFKLPGIEEGADDATGTQLLQSNDQQGDYEQKIARGKKLVEARNKYAPVINGEKTIETIEVDDGVDDV